MTQADPPNVETERRTRDEAELFMIDDGIVAPINLPQKSYQVEELKMSSVTFYNIDTRRRILPSTPSSLPTSALG